MSYATLDEFRGRRRASGGFPILIVLSGVMVLLGMIIGATELITYSNEYNNVEVTFGNDVTIGEVQVGGLNEGDRLRRLESVYIDRPIYLRYNDILIELIPSEIGFRLDTESMQAAAAGQLDDDFWGGFWKFLWREETRSLNIPLYAEYDPGDLRAYLENIAAHNDIRTDSATFDSASGTFRSAGEASLLDIDATMPLVEAALYARDAKDRIIQLPIQQLEGRDLGIADLEAGILQWLNTQSPVPWDGPNGVVSVFVIDLQTGEEININADVLHDGMSNIKVGVMINYFRYRISDPSSLEKRQLANAVICSDNGDANNLIYTTSTDGSYVDGIRRLNQTFCEAGAPNTQLLSNLYIGEAGEGSIPASYYTIVAPYTCPVRDIAPLDNTTPTQPVNQNQATAAEVGTLLMNIYDCAMYGSGLQTIFEGEITQTECQQMIEVMRGTHFLNMMELGVPEGTDLAHKVGYVDDTSGDVGIVMTPGGDYVFAMYVWEEGGRGDGLLFDSFKWPMFGDVNRIVYNYFNPANPMTQTRAPAIDGSGVSCVLPQTGYDVNLFDINEHRFTPEGVPDTTTGCYDPADGCRPFDGWGFAP